LRSWYILTLKKQNEFRIIDIKKFPQRNIYVRNIYNKQTIANMITSKNFLDATLQGCRLMPDPVMLRKYYERKYYVGKIFLMRN